MNTRDLGAVTMLMLILVISGCSVSRTEKPSTLYSTQPTDPITISEHSQELGNPVSAAVSGTYGWYILRNKNHLTPEINSKIDYNLTALQAYYVGKNERVIYLTFDEGYENGYTSSILETLQKHQVPAAFFVTEPYITGNPGLIQRMVAEGHMVVNHSKTHPSMPTLTGDPQRFNREILDTAAAFKNLTGQDMAPYFRPPRGEFNRQSLELTSALGYKTIFWSFAYEDWLVDRQPDPEEALNRIMQNIHPGEIMLLHAVSRTNNAILERVLTACQADGYRFASLQEISDQT